MCPDYLMLACRSEVRVALNNGDFTAKACQELIKYVFLKGNLARKKL
jgi:hypothetical protein